MKRFNLFLVIALAVLFSTGQAFAAGSVTTDSVDLPRQGITVCTYEWTAAADGSVPATAKISMVGYVILAVTDPGTTAPTDDYDIELTDAYGCDVMGGELSNRDTANSEQAMPAVGSTYGPRWVSGPVTLEITNNSVNSATGKVIVYIAK